MDGAGEVLEETSYENTIQQARQFAERTGRRYGTCRAVCEPAGSMRIGPARPSRDAACPYSLQTRPGPGPLQRPGQGPAGSTPEPWHTCCGAIRWRPATCRHLGREARRRYSGTGRAWCRTARAPQTGCTRCLAG